MTYHVAHLCSHLTTISLAASASILSPPTGGGTRRSSSRVSPKLQSSGHLFARWQRLFRKLSLTSMNSVALLAGELLGHQFLSEHHFAHLAFSPQMQLPRKFTARTRGRRTMSGGHKYWVWCPCHASAVVQAWGRPRIAGPTSEGQGPLVLTVEGAGTELVGSEGGGSECD